MILYHTKVEAGPNIQLYTHEPVWGQLNIVDAIFDGPWL